MRWLDILLGRPEPEEQAREEDEQALKDLRTSFKRVGVRTERLLDAYARAEARRRKQET